MILKLLFELIFEKYLPKLNDFLPKKKILKLSVSNLFAEKLLRKAIKNDAYKNILQFNFSKLRNVIFQKQLKFISYQLINNVINIGS
jgi:hypothetical protein